MTFITLEEALAKFESTGLRITRSIGSGGYKVVFEAFDSDGRHLALKVIDPDKMDYPRLLREAQAMETIDSDYVAKIVSWDFGNKDTKFPYLVEEFIEGEPLWDQWIARKKTGSFFTPVETVNFLSCVLQGLRACAEKKIVHRDIKPQNIMIRPDNTPVIIDFGVARHLDQSSLTSTHGPYPGITVIFAPPELIDYKQKLINETTDLFSLGIVAYMMLSGKHPYLDLDERQNVYENMLEAPVRPLSAVRPDVPKDLETYIMYLIRRKAFERMPSVQQAINRLPTITEQ